MSEQARQQTPEPKLESFNQTPEETLSSSSFATLSAWSGLPNTNNRPVINSNNILFLQRTIGNQAVQRLIKGKNVVQTHQTVQRYVPGKSVQDQVGGQTDPMGTTQSEDRGVPSYQKFVEGWEKKVPGVEVTIFTPESDHFVKGSAIKELINSHKPKANIIEKYKKYDSEKTLDNLTELFHTITYWETLNHGNSGQPWYQGAIEYLGVLQDKIKAEVKSKIDTTHGPKAESKPADSILQQGVSDGSNQAGKDTDKLPEFVQEVGVPTQYFTTHLKDKPDRLGKLQEFYEALKEGKADEGAAIYEQLKDVPGMYMIKSLFVTHFANKINMDKIFGTDSHSTVGQALTDAEKTAINDYSTTEYDNYNNQLRATSELQKNMDNEKSLVRLSNHNVMTRIVSGLNKLPKFTGICYRGFKNAPEAYFEAVQPGAVLVDLAFQSASPSLEGVRNYLNKDSSARKDIYLMIRSKTAVNIAGIATQKGEAEVLFRPGTRFQVQKVWQYVDGKIPREAPPEAQIMLHSLGEKLGNSKEASIAIDSRIRLKVRGEKEEEIKNRIVKARSEMQKKRKDFPEEKLKEILYNPVKVIELIEV